MSIQTIKTELLSIKQYSQKLALAKKDQRDIFRVRPRFRLPDLDPKKFMPSKEASAFHWDGFLLCWDPSLHIPSPKASEMSSKLTEVATLLPRSHCLSLSKPIQSRRMQGLNDYAVNYSPFFGSRIAGPISTTATSTTILRTRPPDLATLANKVDQQAGYGSPGSSCNSNSSSLKFALDFF